MTTTQITKYAAVKFLGTAFSVCIFFYINDTYKEQNIATVQNTVAKAELKLVEELNKINLVIESMAFFYENSEEVSQGLFKRFTDPFLKELNGRGSLQWAPMVEDGKNDFKRYTIIKKIDSTNKLVVSTTSGQHFPIQTLNPIKSLQKAVGFDLYSDSIRKQAIDKAIETRKIALSGPINLVLNGNGTFGIMAVKSVLDTVSKQVKGVVAGVYRMDALIGNNLASELKIVDINVHDLASDHKLLYASSTIAHSEELLQASISKKIHAADRVWAIKFTPKPAYFGFPHLFESYVVLVFGLLSTLLLTYVVKKER